MLNLAPWPWGLCSGIFKGKSYIHTCIYKCVYIYMGFPGGSDPNTMCVCVCVSIYLSIMCVCVCVYLSIYLSIYIYIYIYFFFPQPLGLQGTWAYLLHGMWDVSSPTRDGTNVPCVGRWILNHWSTRRVPVLFSVLHRVTSLMLLVSITSNISVSNRIFFFFWSVTFLTFTLQPGCLKKKKKKHWKPKFIKY